MTNTAPVSTTFREVLNQAVVDAYNSPQSHLPSIVAEAEAKCQRICASEQTKAVLDAETEMRLKFDARQHDFATFEWMIAQLNDYVGSLQTQLEGETHGE